MKLIHTIVTRSSGKIYHLLSFVTTLTTQRMTRPIILLLLCAYSVPQGMCLPSRCPATIRGEGGARTHTQGKQANNRRTAGGSVFSVVPPIVT
jgi:hypothetical protein